MLPMEDHQYTDAVVVMMVKLRPDQTVCEPLIMVQLVANDTDWSRNTHTIDDQVQNQA